MQGTEIYDAKKGSFVDVGILDVMQIFGRAGRPQFDTEGHGYIITKHDKLSHYLTLLTRQTPIESQFVQSLTDNLNAEVAFDIFTFFSSLYVISTFLNHNIFLFGVCSSCFAFLPVFSLQSIYGF